MRKMRKMRPVSNNIIVKVGIEGSTETPGGIVLPETVTQNGIRGEVVSVGPGQFLPSGERSGMIIKKGDEIMIRPNCGTEVDSSITEGWRMIVVNELDVMVIYD